MEERSAKRPGLRDKSKPATLITMVVAAAALVFLTAGCSGGERRQEFAVYTVFGTGSSGNSYIAASAGEAAVIDTGTPEKVLADLKENNLKLKYIVLTHGHFDHIGGVAAIRQKYPEAQVYIHPGDRDMLADPAKNLSARFGKGFAVKGDFRPLTEKTVLKLGRGQLEVVPTPGHTPGSVCIKAGNTLFSGDTLFREAVGRTDFPGGNSRELAASLQKLKKLPDDTRIMPGHGDPTTLGEEKRGNPFLAGKEL